MAEMLVQNFNNWLERLTPIDLSSYISRYPKTFQAKYDARSKKGDIVEIQEDGFWTVVGRGWDKEHYDLLVVPGLGKKEARDKYGGCLIDGETIKVKFKTNITMAPDVDKKQELTKTAFETVVKEKTVLTI